MGGDQVRLRWSARASTAGNLGAPPLRVDGSAEQGPLMTGPAGSATSRRCATRTDELCANPQFEVAH